jgi:hypothetical protein
VRVALQQIFPSTAFRINLPLQKTNLLVLSQLICDGNEVPLSPGC